MLKLSTLSHSLLAGSLALVMNSQFAEARIFTNSQNKKIDAEIENVEGDSVSLKILSNSKVYTLKIDTLSEADQTYIKEWAKEKAEAEEAEKKETPKTPRRTGFRSGLSFEGLKEKYNLSANFDEEWPTLVSADIPEITIVKEEVKEFVYESANYQFICDVRLSKSVVKKFAHLFEATREFCKAIPLSMLKAHIPDGTKKYKILLFETREAYVKNGGPPSSGGVYMSGRDIIMIPLTSLGVIKSGSSYRYDYDGSNQTLSHEIAHQLTNGEYFRPGARGWFSEGLAEYIAMTNYRSGKFLVRGNDKDVEQKVTGFDKKTGRGRNLGEVINAPDLKQYMTMSYGNFTASNGNFNYGFGALVTCYFLHFEKETGRQNINAFLKALNEGKAGEEALSVLLNGRTYDELEKDIAKAWKSRGVKIYFK